MNRGEERVQKKCKYPLTTKPKFLWLDMAHIWLSDDQFSAKNLPIIRNRVSIFSLLYPSRERPSAGYVCKPRADATSEKFSENRRRQDVHDSLGKFENFQNFTPMGGPGVEEPVRKTDQWARRLSTILDRADRSRTIRLRPSSWGRRRKNYHITASVHTGRADMSLAVDTDIFVRIRREKKHEFKFWKIAVSISATFKFRGFFHFAGFKFAHAFRSFACENCASVCPCGW